ncbi:MAG: hypothetical protein EYC62_06630 [Alphaproteobacteria bacterium]|nr:MAG: hypothetical protein EYC62_06630 [Alphaproteobacteria bacterium]
MTSFDTRDAERLRAAEPLTAEDFEGAVYYRHSDVLFSRPATYREPITFEVPGPNFQTVQNTVFCEFGDMIVLTLANGILKPSQTIPRNVHDNMYHSADEFSNGCQRIFELIRIRRFMTDRLIRRPRQVGNEFLLNHGDLAAMGLRQDGEHEFMPVAAVKNPRTGRPVIPDYYMACDGQGRLLAQRVIDPREHRER